MLSSPSTDSENLPAKVNRGRFVTLCQQLLALAVVGAVLTPAARTVTMDVRPPASGGGSASASEAAYLRSATMPARVPTAPVDPDVEEYSLTAPAGARTAAGMLRAKARALPAGGEQVTSDAVPVKGYGAVGVTWAHGTSVADDRLAVQVRTQVGGTWTGWTTLSYHDDHGPDPDSAEARDARPGTDPMFVGEVDDVQVRIDTDGAAPPDMKLAVIDPGQASSTARQSPGIDTGDLDGDGRADPLPGDVDSSARETGAGDGGDGDTLDLSAAEVATRPQIFTRAQWGADEGMRDRGSLHYYEVHAGFVHHTVSANDYSRAEVPGMIRGIYAYHTRSQGWSDIGYNFLVDRFGRIWEGRYGGAHRPVVGAHTLGYNDNAFAMSAIGNFETARPAQAMIDAYGRLFAWKLGLHGVDATDKRQWVTSRNFPAINGHRDAGSTACPGRHLYARLGDIRTAAANVQGSWRGRELESNLAGGNRPDLVARRKSDGRTFVLPVRFTDGKYRVGRPIDTGLNLGDARTILKAGDWDRDGYGDLIVRRGDVLDLYRGTGAGKFAAPRRLATGFRDVALLGAVGDMTGDGWPDLVGKSGGSMRIYVGWGLRGIATNWVAGSGIDAGSQIPVGLWDAGGASDSLYRSGRSLRLYSGNGPGGYTSSKALAFDAGAYDWLVGVSDVGLTGHSDLIGRRTSDGSLWLIQGGLAGFAAPVSLNRRIVGFDLAG